MTTEQLEEIEVLRSIFDGDESIKFLDRDNDDQNIGPKIQYLFGESNGDHRKSILIEFDTIFSPDYPSKCGPKLNLNLFYNKNLALDSKKQILEFLESNFENLLGSPMIFSLIELLKENSQNLSTKLWTGVEETTAETLDEENTNSDSHNKYANESTPHVKNAHGLSKAQKRRMWDRGEGTGEKPRGWNWVEIIKHLSQGPSAANLDP